MYTVAKYCFGAEYIHVPKPFNRTFSVFFPCILYVVYALGYMYMKACHTVIRLNAFFKRSIRKGKQRMQSKHSLQHAVWLVCRMLYKVVVFLNGLICFYLAVPVAYLIAKTASYAHFLSNVRNFKK